MKKVTAEGGEGLILRKPGSVYESGRSDNFLKVKSQPEVDVRFIRLHEHMTYGTTLLCELPNGDQCMYFFVVLLTYEGYARCELEVFNNPPKTNSVVTITYDGSWLKPED